ncbi:hypothetical protein D9758_007526 [Tetrapyrgos nigripes]|uniref:MYND-type domain-containing protein n=1 Tax=Tetrapyrgos nigripes TaxID=182062 RepID=A0A8H5G3F4_9AGAR|nr:hypothetical protein D9758_007526 [Tetrapyrgos nigripes]
MRRQKNFGRGADEELSRGLRRLRQHGTRTKLILSLQRRFRVREVGTVRCVLFPFPSPPPLTHFPPTMSVSPYASDNQLISTLLGPRTPSKVLSSLSFLQLVGDQLCSYCLKAKDACPSGLKKCSGCKRISYCSEACQKSDWKSSHKQLCPQFKKVNDFDRTVIGDRPLSLLEFANVQVFIISISDSSFELYGTRQEMRIQIFFQVTPQNKDTRKYIDEQATCQVCNRTPFQKPEYHPFEICSGCNYVRWCSDECKENLSSVHSPKHCAVLRLYVAYNRISIDYALSGQNGRKRPMFQTPNPRDSYIPLSEIADWNDYHCRIFPEFRSKCEATAKGLETSDPASVEGFEMMAMEPACIVLTVIAAIEASGLTTRESLRIHFVGASSRELSGHGMMEELLHYLPCLKNVHITYVGPQAHLCAVLFSLSDGNLACEKCQAKDFSRTASYHGSEYHTFMTRVAGPEDKPDLVIALNSGFTEVIPESWRLTVQNILRQGVPAAFTSYSDVEARQELGVLRDMGAKFLVEPRENKWRGVVPIVNKIAELFSPGSMGMGYDSNWWYVFRG